MVKSAKDLFSQWSSRENHIGSVFNCDGVVDETVWEKQSNQPRILFVLKEAWHKKPIEEPIYDLTIDLKENGPWGLWHRIAEWTRGIILTAQGEYAPYCRLSKDEANSYLRKIAVINVKKSHGESSSKYDDIMRFAEEDADLLYEQIKMINPDIIVCGYTFDFLNKILERNGEQIIDKTKENHCDNWHYKWKDRIVLDYYHPAMQAPSLLLYYGVVGCFKDAIK